MKTNEATGQVPSDITKGIIVDLSDADKPFILYIGEGFSGRDVDLVVKMVKRGYRQYRYDIRHKRLGRSQNERRAEKG